jgi:capsular polysaccharide transport system ATP-binding protein
VIRVRNLTKSYTKDGNRAVIFEDLSFDIETGESVAIMGRNGAGKSTLVRLLGGIDHPDSGTIETDQRLSWPVGLVGGFQGSLTARENVKFVCRIYGSSREVRDKVRFVEEFASIGVHFDRPFKTYSNGMKARVTFGLSMAFDFDVYLMDEVTAVGDQAFREKAKQLVQWRSQNASFIMVSHNLWGLKLQCDRALILHEGKLSSYANINEAIRVHQEQLGVEVKTMAKGAPHQVGQRNARRQRKHQEQRKPESQRDPANGQSVIEPASQQERRPRRRAAQQRSINHEETA